MKIHREKWRRTYPRLASAKNAAAKKKVQTQLNKLASDMGKDLKKILDFIEDMGIWLDDHYQSVRAIVTSA
jgi:hypothetical protein